MMALALLSLLNPDALARCAELEPQILAVADEAGLDESTITALLLLESGCEPVEGLTHDVAGPAQIAWSTWGPLLAGEGWTAGDLLDPELGTLAAGPVLRVLREWWPRATVAQRLCLYSSGTAALGWQSCRYSVRVLALASALRGAGVEVASR